MQTTPFFASGEINDAWVLKELFDFQKGKRLIKADMIPGNINFLGAISENNEIREKLKQLKRLVDDE
ncbi:hypothetical protein D3Z60_05900 [Lachnospiraceae bacterium]|nr:hypothetical protein [Lachnospiraceae bacterium]